LSTGGESILGHVFARPELLREALTHRSVAGRRGGFSNERLEFIGDRVLGLLIAEWLAERFPKEQEGELGRRLAHLVSQPVLAEIADASGLATVLSVGPGAARAGVKQQAAVLADALEAAIGAVYLDGGLEPARGCVRRAWDGAMTQLAAPPKDPKTALQEWLQARGHDLPEYVVATRTGPSHSPEFVITVSSGSQTGTGVAKSKRAAEQAAATDLLQKVRR
jgi:ribonuclease III